MIEVNKLTKTYDRRTRTANTVLHDVTITLPDRGFVWILRYLSRQVFPLAERYTDLDLDEEAEA